MKKKDILIGILSSGLLSNSCENLLKHFRIMLNAILGIKLF